MADDRVGLFFNDLRALADAGDKAFLRANAKIMGANFRRVASPSDVAAVRQELNSEVRGPQPIVPIDQLEDQNRWVAVAGGALEGLESPPNSVEAQSAGTYTAPPASRPLIVDRQAALEEPRFIFRESVHDQIELNFSPEQRLSLLDQRKFLVERGVNQSIATVLLMDLHNSGFAQFEPNLIIPEGASFNWTTGEVYLDGTPSGRCILPTVSAQHFLEDLWPRLRSDPQQAEPLTETSDYSAVAASAEQRPAAYRFTMRGDQIDVLPEPPEPKDREVAVDTYNELLVKARELLDRLKGSNSAGRAYDSIQRLLTALGTSFDDLRPGVLLSRVRSIEADRVAFDSADGRAELFPDALAMLDDTLLSARDLMASFPIIRRIEAERLALDLTRHPDAVPAIELQTSVISAAVEKSEAATPDAMSALQQNDAAINAASDPILRTELVADKLLVVRNLGWALASKVGSELGDLGDKTWQAFKVGLPVGVGLAARALPLMMLANLLVGPLGVIAAFVPAFKPLAGKLQTVVKPAADPIPVHNPKPARPRSTRGAAKSEQ